MTVELGTVMGQPGLWRLRKSFRMVARDGIGTPTAVDPA